jgi:hypothetical protein
MNKQLSFSVSEYAGKKKATRRERFLGEMEEVVPWGKLIALIEPCYPKGERGRPPVGIERMLRIYFLSQWYGLADEALEDAIYDSQAMRNFIGVDLGGESVPDATTLLKFRHLLEENELTRAIFEEIGRHLKAKQLMMKEGTIVDATIISAPPQPRTRRAGGILRCIRPAKATSEGYGRWVEEGSLAGMGASEGAGASPGGASLPHRQKPLRLPESPIPGTEEKSRPTSQPLRPGQSGHCRTHAPEGPDGMKSAETPSFAANGSLHRHPATAKTCPSRSHERCKMITFITPISSSTPKSAKL